MKRFKIKQPIFYGPEHQLLMADYTVNMSVGGVFIETSRILPVDIPLFVEFRLPGKEAPITCKARVAWTNEPGNLKSPTLPPGMGLQFFCLSLENMDFLRGFLDKGDFSLTDEGAQT